MCPKIAAHLRTTEVDNMYVRRIKAMYTNFEFSMVRQVAEEQALLDSGASENLIDEETWKTLGIGAFTLPRPITIYNVDGTENKQGKITRYCWLKVKRGDKEHRMRFFITGIVLPLMLPLWTCTYLLLY